MVYTAWKQVKVEYIEMFKKGSYNTEVASKYLSGEGLWRLKIVVENINQFLMR